MKSLSRIALRDRVREEILYRVQRGHLASGQSLLEVDLAQRLNVSRTPLREALVALERDGFLTSDPGRGFAVRRLDPADAGHIFGLLGALETLALRSIEGWTPELLDEVRGFNLELRDASVEEIPEFDGRFHHRLLRACPNRRLLHAIAREWDQAKCFHYRSPDPLVERDHSIREHDAVLNALSMDAPEAAADFLSKHWKNSLQRLI